MVEQVWVTHYWAVPAYVFWLIFSATMLLFATAVESSNGEKV